AASDLRERRRSPRAWPDVPAVPREPAPPRARPGGCPDPPALQGQEAPRGPRAVGCGSTGRGAAWLARLTGGQKVAGSNPAGPTDELDRERAVAVLIARRYHPERHLRRPDRIDPGLRVADPGSRHDDRRADTVRDRGRH